MPLIGQRIMLRPLEQRDLGPLWEASKDVDLQLMTDGDAPPLSDRQVQEFWLQRITQPAAEMRYFVIQPLAGNPSAGQFAGMCNLHDIDMRNRHAELALWLASAEVRGMGYGTDAIQTLLAYAFKVVQLETVYLGVYDFNEAAIRCYEQIGFRYEGRLRNRVYYQGRCWDEWAMSMTDSEWAFIQNTSPEDGLRPYHPTDQAQAITLIQQSLGVEDAEAARAILRSWWRRIDCDLHSFQLNGEIIELSAKSADGGVQLFVGLRPCDPTVTADHVVRKYIQDEGRKQNATN